MPALPELFAARYGTDEAPEVAAANGTIESLLGHRSVRAFLPDPVGDDILEQVLASAQSASTSSHLQAWTVIAVRDPARKARLAELAGGQKHIREAPLFLVWLADFSRSRRMAARSNEPSAGLDYLESLVIGLVDASLAAQNAVVAAESLGLGAGYIGAMRNRPLEVAVELGLPPEVFAVFGLCLGRPDPERPAAVKPRLSPRVVLHRERYEVREADEAAEIAAFDRIMERFYASQKLPVQPWSRHIVARLKGPESLSGRDRLADALHTLGFKLK